MDSAESRDSFRRLQLILSTEDEYIVPFDLRKIPEMTTVAKVQQALKKG
jgi:acyl carrier protein